MSADEKLIQGPCRNFTGNVHQENISLKSCNKKKNHVIVVLTIYYKYIFKVKMRDSQPIK